jgi:trk system potassium uptake protein TrkH
MLNGKVRQVTLTSKIILWSSLWLSVGGTLLIFVNEPSMEGKTIEQGLVDSFYQAMTAMTTVGFNTVSIGQLSNGTLLVLMVLMIIGASPSGTGGGLKSTTTTAIFGVMRSVLHGIEVVRFWGRPIPLGRIRTATASLGFYLAILLLGTYLLEITQQVKFEQNLFEALSALGTVGLSTGITSSLNNIGKLIVIFLMFSGRLGPLTFGMALFFHPPGEQETSDGDLAV